MVLMSLTRKTLVGQNSSFWFVIKVRQQGLCVHGYKSIAVIIWTTLVNIPTHTERDAHSQLLTVILLAQPAEKKDNNSFSQNHGIYGNREFWRLR